MKKTAGLLVLVLLSTTACFQITVPAKEEPAKPAAAAEESAAPAPARDAGAEETADAGRPHEDREAPPGRGGDHGWGQSRSPMFERCMNSGPAADGVQPAMLQCATAEESRQDDHLNEVYQDLIRSLDGDARDRLRDHERDWIRERDQKCVRDESGGTNAILEEHLCKLDATIDRRAHLERRG